MPLSKLSRWAKTRPRRRPVTVGGYKQSGSGREGGEIGLEDSREARTIVPTSLRGWRRSQLLSDMGVGLSTKRSTLLRGSSQRQVVAIAHATCLAPRVGGSPHRGTMRPQSVSTARPSSALVGPSETHRGAWVPLLDDPSMAYEVLRRGTERGRVELCRVKTPSAHRVQTLCGVHSVPCCARRA